MIDKGKASVSCRAFAINDLCGGGDFFTLETLMAL
jgi:hypothetical protein